jgi:hypothetical protein
MQWCKRTLGLIIKTCWLLVMNQRMSEIYQVDLQPLRKDIFMCRKWLWIIFYYFPISIPLYPHFAQPKDTPLRFMAFTQTSTPIIGLKKGSNKVPCRHIPLHVPISTTRTSFCSSLTLRINPSYNLILRRT